MKTRIEIVAVGMLLAASANGFGQPVITRQPTNQSVSLGANVTFQVTATGTTPLSYQWRFADLELFSATNRTLVMTNVQLAHAGNYTVVVTNSSGSVTSKVARLEVDPSFTKITTGQIVNDISVSLACAWVDYDADGWVDLFVANDSNYGDYFNSLYRNAGDGTFTRIKSNAIVNTLSPTISVAWADMDNDGRPDLFIANYDDQKNRLFRNDGDGVFTRITEGFIVTDSGAHHGGVWGDADGDGLIDLFMVNFRAPDGPTAEPNVLYHNLGNSQFEKITFELKTRGHDSSSSATWCDFDGDGDLDLFVTNGGWPGSQNNDVYRSDHGAFTLLTNAVPALDGGSSASAVWGDYDNDGYPDLFVGNIQLQKNFLYHNNGDGTFARVTTGDIVNDVADSFGCAWADYDNDGWLDLFVANGEGSVQNNYLYHNNGDGTFTKITSGSLVNDGGASAGCAWADYDNDGFLDLFVSNHFVESTGTPQRNFLYRNNGNTNSWLNVRLVGTVSNRSAIGAKVRLKATIAGKTLWQLREISGGSGFGSQNDLRAHFGLGDATKADLVRIEWPSGIAQEFPNVPAKQFLTITEPPRLLASITNGIPQFTLKGGRGFEYEVNASDDLLTWAQLATLTITNFNGTAQITDPNALSSGRRFYRAVSRQ